VTFETGHIGTEMTLTSKCWHLVYSLVHSYTWDRLLGGCSV